MNDTVMTVVGNVVDQPSMRRTKNGTIVSNFRLASTSRRFDREQGRWTDNDTLYVTVTAWRALGENVGHCVLKGQPVLVTGRFFMREYEVDGMRRYSYELDATAVGHDLSRGTSRFERVHRQLSAAVDADGIPEDDSDRWIAADATHPGGGQVHANNGEPRSAVGREGSDRAEPAATAGAELIPA